MAEELHDFLDYDTMRNRVYDGVVGAMTEKYPLENDKYRLEVADLNYGGPPNFSLKDQKNAILQRKSVYRPLKGTWRLIDKANNNVVDERKGTIMNVPHLTSRGTYILRGNEYTVANQMRLRSGVYARKKENGELETHFNVGKGGHSFRVFMEPTTGVFRMQVGQAKLKMYPILKAMGVTDSDMTKWLGPDLFAANVQETEDQATIRKVWDRMTNARERKATGEDVPKAEDFKQLFNGFELDPQVTKRTLGTEYSTVTPEVLLRSMQKMININAGKESTDDRDSLAYQETWSADDFFKERIKKDSGRIASRALWKATLRGNLGGMAPGALNPQMDAVFFKAGVAQPIEEINPIDALDQNLRLTRLGEGGLSSERVTDEARNVNPSQFMFVDPVRSPESSKIGVDSRVTVDTVKGDDRQLYTKIRDLKTGKIKYLPPAQIVDATVAFPGEVAKAQKEGRKYVKAMVAGRLQYAKISDVDYDAPSAQGMFTVGSNLVPLISAIKGGRLLMGAKMASQALPLSDPEAPLVRSMASDGESFYDKLGTRMGTVKSSQGGVVQRVTKDRIIVKQPDNELKEYELYDNFPLNRKTFLSSTPTVKPGDEIRPGQLLAKSNFTDNEGVVALGKNLKVAYVPYKGLNFEDAIVISETAAKKMASEHMYTEKMDLDNLTGADRNKFISLFPKKYDRSQLEKMDDAGVVLPGQTVVEGDPLILATQRRTSKGAGMLYHGAKTNFTDAAVEWHHSTPGIVTDVWSDKTGVKVAVKTYAPSEEGDKMSGRYGDKSVISKVIPDDQMPVDANGEPLEVLLNPLGVISRCYDERTEFLTRDGWKYGKDVSDDCELMCFNKDTSELCLQPQLTPFYATRYTGDMLRFSNKLTDLCVTPNHKMWARCAYDDAPWQEVTAARIYGKRWYLPVTGSPVAGTRSDFILPHLDDHVKDTAAIRDDVIIPAEVFAAFLGWYLSEGHTTYNPVTREYRVHISQSIVANPDNCLAITKLLDQLPFNYHYSDANSQFHIRSKRLAAYCKQFGLCYEKYIPEWIFQQPYDIREIFLDALWAGDGSETRYSDGRHVKRIGQTSPRLADDIQRLGVYQGRAGRITVSDDTRTHRRIYRCSVQDRDKVMTRAHGSETGWERIAYDGMIYCPTVSTGYVVTRRNGKLLIAGNTNPAQMLEAVLGKIAAARGKPYNLDGFTDEDLVEFTIKEMESHGIKDTEDLFDPETRRKLPGILTGRRYMMKLHHTAECFDDKTEVLTSNGWRYWKDVRPDDKLATTDTRGNSLFFERPLHLLSYDYDGTLYTYSGRYLDYAVTPNHNLWCKSYGSQRMYGLRQASEMHGRRFKVKQFGFDVTCPGGRATVTVGANTYKWDDMCELVGWWVTEGCIESSGNAVMIYQSSTANYEKVTRIETLLTTMGVAWTHYKAGGVIMGFRLADKDLVDYLKPMGSHAELKHLSRDIIEGPLSGCRRALEAMLLGDGSYYATHDRFTSTSKQLVDDFQEMAIRTGAASVVREDNRKRAKYVNNPHYLTAYSASYTVSRENSMVDGDRHPEAFALRPYVGKVYCAEMRSGLLYVRRNGKPMLSGNSKASGRALGAYTSEGLPSRGGVGADDDNPKRVGSGEMQALLSHGAIENIKDIKLIRGQRNDDYWRAMALGYPPPSPDMPNAYKKFLSLMRAAGINTRKKGNYIHLTALTDKDVTKMSAGAINKPETVRWLSEYGRGSFGEKSLDPIEGGLFDRGLTGGHGGNRWSHIQLSEPIPQPAMEDPIRRLFDMTKQQYRDVIAGKAAIPGAGTGGQGIYNALSRIKVEPEIARLEQAIRAGGSAATRDANIKKLGYLKAMQANGTKPSDLVITKVPVLPPIFRPITATNKFNMVAGANLLYMDLMHADKNLKELAEQAGSNSDIVNDARISVYDSVKAITGLGDPIKPERRQQNVQGVLSEVFGSSPKMGQFQRRLLGASVDLSGRATVTPNPSLDMDQIGIPEAQAWKLYGPFVTKRLIRSMGDSPDARATAVKMVAERAPKAREALEKEMENRPVLSSRAPALHRYSMMAFKPVLSKGKTLQLSPAIVTGFNADFDGDAMNFHVVVSDKAVEEAKRKMLPSMNLRSPSDFGTMWEPRQEFLQGLYSASTRRSGRKSLPKYRDPRDVIAAFNRGEVDVEDVVSVND